MLVYLFYVAIEHGLHWGSVVAEFTEVRLFTGVSANYMVFQIKSPRRTIITKIAPEILASVFFYVFFQV